MNRSQLVLIASITLLASYPAHAQRGGRCGYDIGNICLNACGTMQQTQFDNGVYDAAGNFNMTWMHVDCSNADLVCGWDGDGIDYGNQNGSCPSGAALISPEDWRFLERVSHGHPVLTASCAGGLYPAQAGGHAKITSGAKNISFKFPTRRLLFSQSISRRGDL